MRSPSSRVLTNRVDVYPAVVGQDPDGAPQFTYAQTPRRAAVPCSVQVGDYEEVEDDQRRVTRYLTYKIMFGSYPFVKPRDKIVWVDRGGVAHTLLVRAARDEAGRGGAFTVRAVERA